MEVKDVTLQADEVLYSDRLSIQAKGLNGRIDTFNFRQSVSAQVNEAILIIDEIKSINSEFKLVSSEIKISNDLGANSAYFKVGEFLSQDGRLLNVSHHGV